MAQVINQNEDCNLSDVHANLEAFLAVSRTFPPEDATSAFCLGDTVGYGQTPQNV